jgi:hypothetical protein
VETVLEYRSAKKNILNDSGNMIMVVVLITMITSFIAYWISVSSKVDKETRTLDSTKRTAYLRSDFKNTIHRSLEGTNILCPTANLDAFKNKFHDFAKPITEALHEETFTGHTQITIAPPSPTVLPISNVLCYFNPTRYTQPAITSEAITSENQIEFLEVKVTTRRTTEPNYSTLSNFISTDVLVRFKLNKKENVLKYQFKYRIDVLDLSRYGLIFTDSNSNPSSKLFNFSNSTTSVARINALTLFDHPDRDQTLLLSRILNLPVSSRLIYNRPVHLAAKEINIDDVAANFLINQTLYSSFRGGISTNVLEGVNKAPYEYSLSEWKEFLDFKQIDEFYPLPKMNSTNRRSIIWNEATTLALKTYDQGDLTSTDTIYPAIYPDIGKKSLTQSCKKKENLGVEPYPLFIFKNFEQDFTIDFQENNSSDYPPVFCGLIIARNLIIKLNNTLSTSDYYAHHIIGKFILSGTIQIIGNGQLHLHDLLNFTEDQVQYQLELDATNLRTQMYNQKFYSTQNFMLPFFKDDTVYNTVPENQLQASTNLSRFYVPRSTRSFFNNTTTCGEGTIGGSSSSSGSGSGSGSGSFSAPTPTPTTPPTTVPGICRVANIDSPALDKLVKDHWQKLIFEVYDVE